MKYILILSVLYCMLLTAEPVFIQSIGLFLDQRNATQWIELQNSGSSTVDISGWSLHSDDLLLFKFPPDTILEPGARVRVNLVSGNGSESDNEGFHVALAKPWIDRTLLSPEEFEEFWREYQLFCVIENENSRNEIYNSLKNLRDRVPFILKKLFLKSATQEVEDSVLLINIFHEQERGFHVAALGSYGLAPITILERSADGFDNIQAQSFPPSFTVNMLRLTKLLRISIEPSYLLWQEKDTKVEIQLATDEAMNAVFWSKKAPIVIGSSIVITPDDRAILEEHADHPFYCSIKIITPRFTSQVIAQKISKLDIYNAEASGH